ncbi:hypothetical protein SLS53_009110 [Cytospora paraplurivora]|uniref:Uncharacterized protein n=1 Tax=Cytospora paraplurivora TaxID=2898453 RepID=A0AAN9U5U9_9PEZI
MDTRSFFKIITILFTVIVDEYLSKYTGQIADGYLKQLLLGMLKDEFQDLDASVSIIKRIHEALEQVFWVCSQMLDLDILAVRQVLPSWKDHFEHIFNRKIRQLLPRYSPQFDIMRFMGPAMDSSTFIRSLNNHIDAFTQLHGPENVELPNGQQKLVLKPNKPANAQPTPSGSKKVDQNFYHRCMYCTAKDTCSRDDDAQDHMRKVHNYYDDREDNQAQERDYRKLKRKNIGVLKAIIKKERAVYNSLISRYLDTGIKVGNFPRPRDVQGEDLGGLTHAQLLQKLHNERASLDDMDLDEKIGKIYKEAWEFHWACSASAWENDPDA